MSNSWDRPKTPQELAEFREFVNRLDDRNFRILPFGEAFRGSALAAKHRAIELMAQLGDGETVCVVNSEGTVWRQQKRSGVSHV